MCNVSVFFVSNQHLEDDMNGNPRRNYAQCTDNEKQWEPY